MRVFPQIEPEFFTEIAPRTPIPHGQVLEPRVSIVMPSFNKAAYIESSILSVLNQQYDNLQLIIMDGGSTDGTVEIIRKYDAYIDDWVSEPDGGQSDALNKGFERATGDVFGWLNADDVYMPGAISQAVQALQKNTHKHICFGDWVSMNETNGIFAVHPAFDFRLGHLIYEGFPLNAQAMFWKKEVHDRFSGFQVELQYTMDYQMMVEFGRNEGDAAFLRIPKFLGGFRRYKGQKTEGYTPEVHAEHVQIALRYGFSDKFLLSGRIKRWWFRLRRAWWYFRREGIIRVAERLTSKNG